MNFPRTLAALVTGISLSAPVLALDAGPVQLHGFASQAYLHSNGNNYYGDSTDGSTDYYEVGANASWRLAPNLSVSGQVLAREAGRTDNGDLRTDYFFVDYKAVEQLASGAGIRIGKVRNPYGFYNATRDVLFTRPTVLLPQSIYLEGLGIRELLFSSDGAQLYSYWDQPSSSTSFTATFGRDQHISQQTLNSLFGGFPLSGDVFLRTPIFARVLHERDGGAWRTALSLLRTEMVFEPDAGSFFPPGSINVEALVFSLQRNFEKLSLTSEVARMAFDTEFPMFRRNSNSEGVYLQGEYRFLPTLSGVLRYDVSFGDAKHRETTDTQTTTLGARWTPHPNLVIAGDIHIIHGKSGIPQIDNQGQILDNRTELAAVMVGFRF